MKGKDNCFLAFLLSKSSKSLFILDLTKYVLDPEYDCK